MQMISEQKVDSGCVQTEFSASTLLPAVLRLTLKKQWFDMIASGEKKEEYRDIKKYWAVRLCGSAQYNGNDKGLLPNDKSTYWNGFYPINFKKFDYVEFKNGYSKDAPLLLVECKGIDIGYSRKGWCPDGYKDKCFVIQLGKIVMSRI